MSDMDDFDREWSQEELRAYLLGQGFPEGKIGSEPIPQGVKFVDWKRSRKFTPEDIAWAKKLDPIPRNER